MFPLRDNIPSERTPWVTWLLILLNVVAYFGWQKGGLSFGDPSSPGYLANLIDWGAIPYEITHPGQTCGVVAQGLACGTDVGDPAAPATWLTVLSMMFMHGGLLHLGGNMLFLFIFGNNVEDRMGHVRFVAFYLLSGLAALAAQVAIDPSSTVPTVGASGAIAGVLGAYLMLYPRARVLTAVFIILFFTIIEIPAVLVLVLWFGQQVLFGYFGLANPTSGGGGVAYFAHIGGFIFGFVLVRTFAAGVGRADGGGRRRMRAA